MSQGQELNLGAIYLGDGRCRFCVWAPSVQKVEARIVAPPERIVLLEKGGHGYHQAVVEGVEPSSLYVYRLDDAKQRPDPASRFQPQGAHGPSQVVNPQFAWKDDDWCGLPLEDYIIYELHVGTFTPEGTFDAIVPHLDELRDLGVTAIELMPVAQFPGNRNWGYDGVFPFAVQNSYGGPKGLKRLINACHQQGLAVVLDVVYNHLGPEGNSLGDFGPYFTERYRTPWGAAINFDGPHSDEVKEFFTENALYWITEFHIDALRLDALHAILDLSARPFLEELATAVHERAERIGRRVYLIAESDLNDTKLIRSQELGGYGLDAQWNDDFHHALHTLLTGEREGYYQDFGKLAHLAKAFAEGYVYSGQYSTYRRRRHGNSSKLLAALKFVVCSQNHDQIGNRAVGDRLSSQLPWDALKVIRTVVLLSPNVPLLFMGEEYGETAPFQYFVEHGDPDLVEAVRQGRKREFAHFGWDPEDIPDPQDPATFERSRLNRDRLNDQQTALLRWSKALIQLRKEEPSLGAADGTTRQHRVWMYEQEQVLVIHRWSQRGSAALLIFGFNKGPVTVKVNEPQGSWNLRLASVDKEFGGTGRDSIPACLAVSPQGTSISVPAYGAAVFMAS